MNLEGELSREETVMKLLGEAHALLGFVAISSQASIIKEEALVWLKDYADFSEKFFEEVTRTLELIKNGAE